MSIYDSNAEIGQRIEQAFRDAADAMQRLAQTWNDGKPPPSAPLLSQAQVHNPQRLTKRPE